MISLTRNRTAKAVHAKYRGADKRETDKQLMLARKNFLLNPTEKIEYKSLFWKTAKKQLKKESNGKCAYCEANTEVVAHGDVEHYRPKSIYWWMAYTYDNYLYACQICNQVHKSDNFPINGILYEAPLVTIHTTNDEIEGLTGKISPDPIDVGLNYTLEKYINAHNAEHAFLVNPYLDDPTIYFAYEADDTLEEVKIVPTKDEYESNVKASEDFYGINRIELKNARYAVFAKFRAFKMAYPALTDTVIKNEVKKQIDNMLSDKYIFAGMNRYFNDKL